MFEFNNRVDLQRNVIKLVNNNNFQHELTGLTQGAIDQWISLNKIENADIKNSLYKIASKLFFLANKSQEQITEDYKKLSLDLNLLIQELKTTLGQY